MAANIVTITGRSLSGKTTLARCLEESGNFSEIVSHTTRPPRPNETPGKDYYFVDRETFNGIPMAGGTIIGPHLYGTSIKELEHIAEGPDVGFAVVDPRGVAAIAEWCEENGVQHIKVFRFVTEYEQLCRWFNRARNDEANLKAHIKRLQDMRSIENDWPASTDWNYVTVHGGSLGMKVNVNGIRKMCGLEPFLGGYDEELFYRAPA